MSDRIVLRKAGPDGFIPSEPLTWNREGGLVWVVCANGHIAGLQHDIDPDGFVDPSILCRTPVGDPYTECGWHVFATLEEYA